MMIIPREDKLVRLYIQITEKDETGALVWQPPQGGFGIITKSSIAWTLTNFARDSLESCAEDPCAVQIQL